MKNINEKFADFEIAKLLNELGFDGDCLGYYLENGELNVGPESSAAYLTAFSGCKQFYKAPIWQDVEDWLMEKHGIEIEITNRFDDLNLETLENKSAYDFTVAQFGYYFFDKDSSDYRRGSLYFRDESELPLKSKQEALRAGILSALNLLTNKD